MSLFQLANTFNEMLNRLESSLKPKALYFQYLPRNGTPLSAIIGELELSISRERNMEEYKSAIKNALEDTNKLVRLSNDCWIWPRPIGDSSEIAGDEGHPDWWNIIDARPGAESKPRV